MPSVIWNLDQKRNLARTRRLLSDGAKRLIAQQKRISTLRARRYDTGDAEHLLDILEDSQLAMYAHLLRRESGFWR